ncbi:MAG: 50S ribosomal protein L30 [Candidatus Micrarchaeota archaeon]
MSVIVIRVRGSCETRERVEETLRQMRLGRKNHCVIVDDSPQTRGKLLKAKDFITWGPATPEAVALLLEKRGEVSGGKNLGNEYLAKNSKFKTIKEFAEALASGSAKPSDVKGLKQVFRLAPPRKGFGSIKKPLPKGALGPRKEIDSLVKTMA